MRAEHGSGRPITILMADDDEDDRDLARDALEGTQLGERMEFVIDGQDLIDYVRHDGPYAEAATPRPSIILLDLNMPRKDGRESLAELKADESLRQIPVVILTTSSDEVDVQNAYALGASSYITKPVTHGQLIEVMQMVARYLVRGRRAARHTVGIGRIPDHLGNPEDRRSYDHVTLAAVAAQCPSTICPTPPTCPAARWTTATSCTPPSARVRSDASIRVETGGWTGRSPSR